MSAIAEEKTITVSEAREKLVQAWEQCEFGVKERVKKKHSHRTIQYIMATPTYSNLEMILDIIETIKEEVGAIEEEAKEMNKKVNQILK